MPPRLHVRFLATWALAGGMVAAAWTTATGQTRREPPAKPREPAPASRPAETPQPLQVVRMSTGPDGAIVARLSNGLTAIVKASRSAPVVCVRCYVKAGSLYEGRWLGAGLSHLVEHLVAKGAVHGHSDGGAKTESAKETRSRVARCTLDVGNTLIYRVERIYRESNHTANFFVCSNTAEYLSVSKGAANLYIQSGYGHMFLRVGIPRVGRKG